MKLKTIPLLAAFAAMAFTSCKDKKQYQAEPQGSATNTPAPEPEDNDPKVNPNNNQGNDTTSSNGGFNHPKDDTSKNNGPKLPAEINASAKEIHAYYGAKHEWVMDSIVILTNGVQELSGKSLSFTFIPKYSGTYANGNLEATNYNQDPATFVAANMNKADANTTEFSNSPNLDGNLRYQTDPSITLNGLQTFNITVNGVKYVVHMPTDETADLQKMSAKNASFQFVGSLKGMFERGNTTIIPNPMLGYARAPFVQ